MDLENLDKRLDAIERRQEQILELLQGRQSESEASSGMEMTMIMAADDPVAALKERERRIKARNKRGQQ